MKRKLKKILKVLLFFVCGIAISAIVTIIHKILLFYFPIFTTILTIIFGLILCYHIVNIGDSDE